MFVMLCLPFLEGLSAHFTFIDEYVAGIFLTLAYSIWAVILLSMALGIQHFGFKTIKLLKASVKFYKSRTTSQDTSVTPLSKALTSVLFLFFFPSYHPNPKKKMIKERKKR